MKNENNPFRAKADAARAKAEAYNPRTAYDEAMRESFPLGGGFGRKGGEKRISAAIDRACKAVQLRKEAAFLEAKADAFDAGKIDECGRRWSPEQQERSEKRMKAAAAKAERIAAAKRAIEGKDPLDVDPATWATAHGYLGGPGREVVMHDHTQRIHEARAAHPDSLFGVMGEIFKP